MTGVLFLCLTNNSFGSMFIVVNVRFFQDYRISYSNYKINFSIFLYRRSRGIFLNYHLTK
jgi:hypothetical protein